MHNKVNVESLYLSPSTRKEFVHYREKAWRGRKMGGEEKKGDATHKGPGSRSSGRVSSIVVATNIPKPGFLFSIL